MRDSADLDPVTALAEALSQDAALKLWSVVVTCLGDLSQDGPAEVSGVILSALVERIGLQPQAMRVALHRLKRDGWIDSRRDGRIGYHRLSDAALRQTQSVSDRIYGAGVPAAEALLAGFPPDASDVLDVLPPDISVVQITRNFALLTGDLTDLPEDWLLATPSNQVLPAWVVETLTKAACEEEFRQLAKQLDGIAIPASPLDRFALRVLAVHGWRRLILRSNPAAEAALGADRAELSCRASVLDLLDRLGRIPPEEIVGNDQEQT